MTASETSTMNGEHNNDVAAAAAAVPAPASVLSGNKVLVIGGGAVGKTHIVQRIIRNNDTTPAVPTAHSIPLEATSALTHVPTRVYHWPLHTRYYSAQLDFILIDDGAVGEFTVDSLRAILPALATECAAVILVYDTTRTQSYDAVRRWLTLIQSGSVSEGVLLVVGNQSANTDEDANTLTAAREWALDNSLEHVRVPYEAAATSAAATAEARSLASRSRRVDDDEDEDGIKRLIAALHSHVWPIAEMKSAPARAFDSARFRDEEEEDEAALEAEIDAERVDIESEIAAIRQRQSEEDLTSAMDEAHTAFDDAHVDETEAERQVATFEQMIDQLQSVRAQVRASRSDPTLTDEERRRRAETTIMSLLSNLGLDDEDDGDDEEDREHYLEAPQ